MKALVIEDSQTGLAVVSQHLERMGILPIAATDGESGVAAFRQHNPDIVLLDVVLPGMDGYEVARRIRAIEQSGEWTPIIFLTARTSDKDLEYGIEVGGDDYLVKPVSEIVLAAKVRAMQRLAQMRLSLLVLTRRLDDANRELRRLTSVDGLTGIANRRCFDESIAREWQRARRNRLPLSILMLDVDYFKQYNDRYGHQAGDECLKAVAKCLEAELKRPADLVARFGGEEFVVMLPETNAVGARRVAEGMRHALASLKMPHEASPVADHVTLSAGVATVYPAPEDGGSVTAMMDAADRALYHAKKSGRNQVALADQAEGVTVE